MDGGCIDGWMVDVLMDVLMDGVCNDGWFQLVY